MRYTLLEIVQMVLSSIDGDEINSITDTTEAMQVATLVKRVYGNLAPKMDYPEKKTLTGLVSTAGVSKPTLMTMPNWFIRKIDWVKYDCKKAGETDTDFQEMEFVELPEFLRRMHSYRPSADSTLSTFDHLIYGQNVQFIIRNDIAPSYYTTWDDTTMVFDAYDSEVEANLQHSKTLIFGSLQTFWTMTDNFVIPLDDHQLLLNECIAWAWAELKQAQHAKAEREARTQLVATSRDKTAIMGRHNYEIPQPNYGRK